MARDSEIILGIVLWRSTLSHEARIQHAPLLLSLSRIQQKTRPVSEGTIGAKSFADGSGYLCSQLEPHDTPCSHVF